MCFSHTFNIQKQSAGALTLNNLAHTDTPAGKLSRTKCEIETPVVGVQRAKGSVARSTDLQS